MEHWNTHSIRKNRFGTVSGRPDALYYLSESFGGTPNLMQNVPDQELQNSWENLMKKKKKMCIWNILNMSLMS